LQVKPDQFALFEAQAVKSLQARRAMQDVPDRNIELMEKYGDRMAKLGKS